MSFSLRNNKDVTYIFQNSSTSIQSSVDVSGGYWSLNGSDICNNNLGNVRINTSTVNIGRNNGLTNQTSGAISIGSNAGVYDQSGNTVAIGISAGNCNQGSNSVAIGFEAGYTKQAIESVAIGTQAGYTSQGNNSVAIGHFAGSTGQGSNSVAIGSGAGRDQSDNSVAIGGNAGLLNQSVNSVAVGASAGNRGQKSGAVAIGYKAGFCNQNPNSIAIGFEAGVTAQGSNSVAIGYKAGYTVQGTQAIAIGFEAGSTSQGTQAIAIGYFAGRINQNQKSIVIDAGASLGDVITVATQGFFVRPIRIDASGKEVLQYDPTTKEITRVTTKTFVIDHPIHQEKYLVHGCLEGPEAGVYYRGRGVITNNTFEEISLPDYAKNFSDFTIQVTPINSNNSYGVSEVQDGKFKVIGDNGKFFWLVHALRNKIDVEPLKSEVTVNGEGPYKYILEKN